MTVATTPELTAGVDERLERMQAQLDEITAELRRQRQQREMLGELTHELGPVVSQAMGTATAELENLELTSEDLVRFARTLAVALPTIERSLAQLEAAGELAGELSGMAAPAMASLTERLQVLEEKGYTSFATAGVGIVDRVVTNFTEEDVEALGDNVVLILETVKEMTQPEIMTMLRRTAHLVNEPEGVPPEPPSLLALLREMREPQVRLGLARMLALLRSLADADTTGR